jgi:hypothetical protein
MRIIFSWLDIEPLSRHGPQTHDAAQLAYAEPQISMDIMEQQVRGPACCERRNFV